MQTLEIILLVIVGAAGLWGYWKGFIQQLGSVGAVVAGVVVCRLFGPTVIGIVEPTGGTSDVVAHVGTIALVYAILYIVAYYAVVLAARLLKLAVKAVFLGPLDRMGGALFNIAKVLIMVSLLLNVYVGINPEADLPSKSAIGGGWPVQKILDIAPAIVGALVPQK